MRLFYHPASSASIRVTLYLRCRGIPASLVELGRTWGNATAVPEVAEVLQAAGGIVQPFAFDADKFEVYTTLQGSA